MAKIAKIQSKPIFCAKDHHVTISCVRVGFFWTKTENFLLFTQTGSSQIFYFLCQQYVPHSPYNELQSSGQSKNYSPQVQVKTTVLTLNTSPLSQVQ